MNRDDLISYSLLLASHYSLRNEGKERNKEWKEEEGKKEKKELKRNKIKWGKG